MRNWRCQKNKLLTRPRYRSEIVGLKAYRECGYLPAGIVPAGIFLAVDAFSVCQYLLSRSPSRGCGYRGSVCRSHRCHFCQPLNREVSAFRSCHMDNRPSDLSERMAGSRKLSVLQETFSLPLDDARLKAREIINRESEGGYTPIVEQWRQLPDGHIEFTMRRVRTAD